MSADVDISLSARPPGGRSWLQRLGRSNAFTITLSITLHAAVFLAFYRVAFREEHERRRIIIPEARLAPAGGTGPSQPGQMPRLNLQPTPPPPAGRGGPAGSIAPVSASPLQLSEMPVVAVNLTGGTGVVVGGVADVPGASTGLAGTSAVESLLGTGYAGNGSGAAVGPACSFFGAAGNAYKVVYVVDVSNSLMFTLDRVIAGEMKRAIGNLTPAQQFHIVLSMPVRMAEFGPRRLVYATGTNKQEANRFIDTHIRRTDPGHHTPSSALRRAFEAGPELVYFLSDGDYEDDEKAALKALVTEKSPRGEIKLTALAFGVGDTSLLEQLARQTGGNFRYVDSK